MNLYLLAQTENTGFDTFDSCVVCAKNEEDARLITPAFARMSTMWAKPENVQVRLIGTAVEGVEIGVICASFNGS